MYLHQTSSLKLQSCKIRSSRSPVKMMAYGGAILVPIIVHLNCLKKQVMLKNIVL